MRVWQLLRENRDLKLFMGGGCYALALYLSKKTHLDLWGIFDDYGDMHHAFVFDREMAYDARGAVEIGTVQYFQGRLSRGSIIRPTTFGVVAEYCRLAEHRTGPISDRRIRQYVQSVPALASLVKPQTVKGATG